MGSYIEQRIHIRLDAVENRVVVTLVDVGIQMVFENIAPDEPAHRAAGKNIGREMFPRCEPGHAHDAGKAVGENGRHLSRCIFMSDQ